MLAILFIFYILSAVLKSDRIVSTLIRDNKLIAVYQSTELNNTKVRVFGLKDGTTRDIFNSGETFNIVHTNKDSDLVGFDTLDSLKENKNKIWLRLEYRESTNNPTEFSTTNRLRYIDLDTMTLNNDSNFIKFPTAENFPVKGYTVNSITNELGSALYITGGYIYNKTLGSYSFSSSFYKYNFASKEWVDMAYSADGKLKPLAGHKSVVIGNRYLVILGGGGENIYNYNDHNPTISEFNSLYNLTIFDTLTNNWENVNIKTDIFDTNIANFQFEGFSIVEYKDKAIVLGGYIVEQGSNLFRSNEYLGILDFKSKSWNWSPMLNEDGSSYKPLGVGISIQVFNDQFIVCTDVKAEENIPIHVLDIASLRIKSTLNSTNSINGKNGDQSQSKTLPAYAIVLIAVGSTMLLAGFMYLLYRKTRKNSEPKNEKTKLNEPIVAIWADPDMDNTAVEFGRDGNLY